MVTGGDGWRRVRWVRWVLPLLHARVIGGVGPCMACCPHVISFAFCVSPLCVTPVCHPCVLPLSVLPLCVQNHPVPVPRALALGTIPPLGHQPVFAIGPGAIQRLHHAALHSKVHLLAIPSQAEKGACHGCDGDAGTVVADGAVGAVETVGAHRL